MLHGSDSEDQAKRELEFFFPMQQTVAVIKPDAVGTKGTKRKGFLVNKCISACSWCKKSVSKQYPYRYYKLSKIDKYGKSKSKRRVKIQLAVTVVTHVFFCFISYYR